MTMWYGDNVITVSGIEYEYQASKPWHDRELLHELYVEKGYTQTEIADACGCSNVTISEWISRHEEAPNKWLRPQHN